LQKKVIKEGRNSILLSQFISMIEDSIKKVPKVPNYNKLIQLLPQLKQMLSSNGDISIPMNELKTMLESKGKKKVIKENSNPEYVAALDKMQNVFDRITRAFVPSPLQVWVDFGLRNQFCDENGNVHR
jgi:vacuolar-type H+-ATPase subunit E/Vma4